MKISIKYSSAGCSVTVSEDDGKRPIFGKLTGRRGDLSASLASLDAEVKAALKEVYKQATVQLEDVIAFTGEDGTLTIAKKGFVAKAVTTPLRLPTSKCGRCR
jgi:hypothetical protein